MSKYKPYSKGRGNSRAGLQFDRLLKACSNSKKPPATNAAGALGRFGVAQFTSTRGALDLPTGEYDQPAEKPSRFSSLNKRPRLETGLKPLQLHPHGHGNTDHLMDSHMPVNALTPLPHALPMQTVMKPRKFFKSRGPMEVEVDPNQARPLRPDISNLQQPFFSSNPNPILGSNQSNINNSTHSSSYKKSTKAKKSELSPPQKNSSHSHSHNANSNFSSVCSPPIKLKIIKDKVTSKFVSVSDGHGTSANSSRVDVDSSLVKSPRGRKKKVNVSDKEQEGKVKRGRGRPPKEGKVPKPPKPEKPEKQKPIPVTPTQPKRTSGRVTRSTIKYNEDDEEEEDSNSQQPSLAISMNMNMNPLLGQENISGIHGSGSVLDDPRNHQQHSEETLRKLEEDAEFQKLSQMLSSMEEENGHGQHQHQNLGGSQPPQSHSHSQQFPNSQGQGTSSSTSTSYGQHSSQSHIFSQSQSQSHSSSQSQPHASHSHSQEILSYSNSAAHQHQHHQSHLPLHLPVNKSYASESGGSDSDSSYTNSQAYMSNIPNPNVPYFQPPSTSAATSSASAATNYQTQNQMYHSQHQNQNQPHSHPETHSHQHQQPMLTIPIENKAQDIRSILEDDWNESFEEQQDSPRKHSHSQHSPPKVSRFDASAFMSQQQQQQRHSPDYQEDFTRAKDSRDRDPNVQNLQRPIPVYGNQMAQQNSNPNQQLPLPPPYSINSSPYAMKNLLGPAEILNIPNPNNYGGDEPQNLVCHKSQSETHTQPQPPQPAHGGFSNSQQSFDSQESQEFIQSQSQSQQSQSQTTSSQQSTVSETIVGVGVKTQAQAQPKKASIFKSRAAKASAAESGSSAPGTEGKKRQAVYKHTFGQVDKTEEQEQKASTEASTQRQQPGTRIFGDYDEFGDEDEADGGDDGDGGDDNLKLRKLKIANSSGSYSSRLMGTEEEEENGTNKVLCKKTAKKLFTVVRNVKAGHELQESGEFHEFDGDIWYILEDLKAKNSINNRCLSAITLAGRCMDQAFRMHLRAHGTVAEFCKELHDAPQHPILSLLAATVLFVLSQDRLNMDLDTESLKLILALTKSDPGNENDLNENAENVKNRQRVIQLCLEMKNRGHAQHLKLEKITASELALETLLYLTSKRAGEWVKHELRSLGGLDSIVEEVDSSFKSVRTEIEVGDGWTEANMERLRKVDRCLQVLQQVTFNHEDNQHYLMLVSTRALENGTRVKCTEASPIVFLEMFQFCKEVLSGSQGGPKLSKESGTVIRDILFSLLRLLVNLSHDYRGIVLGSEIMLSIDGFLELSLHSSFEMANHIPDEKVFDLLIHSLCLLLNLVEYSKKNRSRILQSTIRKHPSGNFSVKHNSSFSSDDSGVEEEVPVLDALIQMFMARERSAKKEEQYTDNILTTGDDQRPSSQKDSCGGESASSSSGNSNKDKDPNSQDQESTSVQDTIDKLIQTAGKHMESSLIAAYISLLIGYLIMDDEDSVKHVRESMPDGKFLPLMVVLKKLFNFMSITSAASGSTRGLKATAVALKFYGKADPASNEELKKIIPD